MNCVCLTWGCTPEMGEFKNGHHPNCLANPDNQVTTPYLCQRCDHEFTIRGRTGTVQSCPVCSGLAEPVNREEPNPYPEQSVQVPRIDPKGKLQVEFKKQPVDQDAKDNLCRLAVLKIPYENILSLIQWSAAKSLPKYMVRMVGLGTVIPEGVEIIDVHHEFMTRTFCIVLRHPSFAVAPEGQELPVLRGKEGYFDYQAVRITQVPENTFDGASPPASTHIRFGEPMPPGSGG